MTSGMSMGMTDLQDLYLEGLQYMHSAEEQQMEALTQMAGAASNPDLRQGFEQHREQTAGQLTRLEQLLDDLGAQPGGKTCQGMQGIVAEGQEIIGRQGDPAVRDAGLIAAAQRAEHYEVSAYGTLRTYAEILGRSQDADLLRTSEDEEKASDLKLTGLARSINMKAMS